MRKKEIEWIADVILHSGIGTMQQRIAMVQRVLDANEERNRKFKEKQDPNAKS